MKETIGRRFVQRFGFYFGIAVVALLVWRIERYMQSEPTIFSVAPIQEKAVDAFLEMNRLLTTLATTLLGAMGLLLFGGFRGKSCTRDLWAAIVGAISAGVSIYYGYAAYLFVIYMLQAGSFDPYNPPLLRDQYAHFYTFLVAVVFFADFVYQNMREENEDDKSGVTGS